MSELRERCLAFYRKGAHRNILGTPVDDLWVFVGDEIVAERARCAALAISLVKTLPECEHKCAALIMRLVEAMSSGDV